MKTPPRRIYMTIFDVMPTWVVYVLTGIILLIPVIVIGGVITLIILLIKYLYKKTKEK